MAKIRISQAARKHNIHWKELVEKLNEAGFSEFSHYNNMVDEEVIEDLFLPEQEEEVEEKEQSVKDTKKEKPKSEAHKRIDPQPAPEIKKKLKFRKNHRRKIKSWKTKKPKLK